MVSAGQATGGSAVNSGSYVLIRDHQSQFCGRTFRVRARNLATDAVQVIITGTTFMWFEPGEYRWVR